MVKKDGQTPMRVWRFSRMPPRSGLDGVRALKPESQNLPQTRKLLRRFLGVLVHLKPVRQQIEQKRRDCPESRGAPGAAGPEPDRVEIGDVDSRGSIRARDQFTYPVNENPEHQESEVADKFYLVPILVKPELPQFAATEKRRNHVPDVQNYDESDPKSADDYH